jgi:hypothetical protein
MDRRTAWGARHIALPLLLMAFLFATNPSRDSLLKSARSNGSTGLRWLATFLESNLRGMMAREEYHNFGVASMVRDNTASFSIGIGGFWIGKSFLSSVPGWFLIFQLVWAVVDGARSLAHQWVEVFISTLWFAHMAQLLEPMFYVEKFESTFYLLLSLVIYVVAYVVLFPSGLFKKSNLQPGSMLYGVGSAVLMYLTAMQGSTGHRSTFRWHTYDVPYSQLSLCVVLLQLLLGSPMGFAGTVAGGIMYLLVDSRVLDQTRW